MLPDAVKDSETEAAHAVRSSESKWNWLSVIAVLAFLSVFFYKSVFLGKPVTKLGLLQSIDTLFNPGFKGALPAFTDPSGYLIFFPNGHFEYMMWSRLVPPIWNPLVACGFPLLGDPQSFIHSPAHLLGLFSTPEAYNALLLLKMALGGVGLVLLGRLYKMSVPASILAALAYELSPRILAQVDIGSNESFFPCIFLGFVWLARHPSVVRAGLVGVLCAFFAFAAHPETVFFAVTFAALLALFTMTGTRVCLSKSYAEICSALAKNAVKAIAYLMVTAIVSLCIAAPLVFPFLQFVREAYLYKEANLGINAISLQDFIAGFYASIGMEPLFIGGVAALLVPLGFFCKRLWSTALSLTLGIAFTLAMPAGPVADLLSQKPFSYVATYYVTPEILMLLSLLAGFGFDVSIAKLRKSQLLLLVVSGIAVVVVPYFLVRTNLEGSPTFSTVWRSGTPILTSTALFGLIALLVCLTVNLVRRVIARRESAETIAVNSSSVQLRLERCVIPLLATLFLMLNFASLGIAGRKILPVNPKFSLAPPAPVSFLASCGRRSLTTGPNLFLPNATMDFGVVDFRCFSPLLPKRYVSFLQQCGGRAYNLYFYSYPDICSRLLDAASVKYVMTRSAVRAEEDELVADRPVAAEKIGRVLPGMRIIDCKLGFDAANSQINADLTWRMHDSCRNRYSKQFFTLDSSGKEIWSDRGAIFPAAIDPLHVLREKLAFPIPRNAHFPVTIAMEIRDTWTKETIIPEKGVAHAGDQFILCKLDADADSTDAAKRHFAKRLRLVNEYPVQQCRIYENSMAVPEAYVVYRAHHFKPSDAESVLKELIKPGFRPTAEVLVEDGREGITGTQSRENTIANVKRPDCNTVLIDCSVDKDESGYLVLTDSYYPGWRCFVDGKESEIHQANYLFRAVKIQNGRHKVRFVFAPPVYYNSVLLSVLVFLAVVVGAVVKRKELLTLEEGL